MCKNDRIAYGAVVGLSTRQCRLVADRLRPIARLAFVESDRADTWIAPSVEFIVVTRRSPHRFWVSALKRLPREQVVFCGGGLSSVCEAIRRLIRSRDATAN